MSARVREMIKIFTERDFLALKSIYDFRCLSFEQVYDLHYKQGVKTKGEVSNDYARKKFKKFKDLGLIEEDFSTSGESVFFLTQSGVTAVKEYFMFPSNIYDEEKHLHRRGFLTSSELRVAPRFISHQHHLNTFVLNLLSHHRNKACRYEDEKHIKSLVGIRPDAILSMSNIDFFLEMDMGTESAEQLNEKWSHYRQFINSQEFACKENKIIVLFIVDGIVRVNQRIHAIKKTLHDRLDDLISEEIEFYIQTPDKLIEIVNKKILPKEINKFPSERHLKQLLVKNHNFQIADGLAFKKYFNNTYYDMYILNQKKAPAKEYMVLSAFYDNFSAYCKIGYFENKRVGYLNKMKRNISLIVVVDDSDVFYKSIKVLDMTIPECIYFTTLDRLKNKPFHEAIFRFNATGDKIIFIDDSQTKTTIEKN